MRDFELGFKLTSEQQDLYNILWEAVMDKKFYVIREPRRRIGKSLILKHLSFDLQSIGYYIVLVTDYPWHDYVADKVLYAKENFYHKLCGLRRDTICVIVDEVRDLVEVGSYCAFYDIPAVGFKSVMENAYNG